MGFQQCIRISEKEGPWTKGVATAQEEALQGRELEVGNRNVRDSQGLGGSQRLFNKGWLESFLATLCSIYQSDISIHGNKEQQKKSGKKNQ